MDHAAPSSQKSEKLPFEQTKVRRTILISYWIVVLLAVPLWWYTTSIERLSLPVSRINSQRGKELKFPLHVKLDTSAAGLDAEALSRDVQAAFDVAASSFRHLDIQVSALHGALSSNVYGVSIVPGLEEPVAEGRRLSIPSLQASHIPQLLTSLCAPSSSPSGSGSASHLVAKYAPHYRLAFTVLNEDAADGNAVIGWDIRNSISRHLSSLLHRVSALHNFTIESQVRYHAPLAFEPHRVGLDNEGIYGLTQDDLKVFVNSAEWTLSSSASNDPVLHFILFIPSASHTPLRILNANNNPTSSNAFILPQWGGVVLFNLQSDLAPQTFLTTSDLDQVFSIFRLQLLSLLGVPSLPPNIVPADPSDPLTDWQLDSLYRQRAIENAFSSKETLESIAKLVNEIPNMPLGQDVRGDVQDALTALEKVYPAATNSPTLALQYSSRALTLASRAFFNPGMLALLYFPAEHKYAVYTPLFAPVAVPLLATALREWKKARARKDTDKQAEEKDAPLREREQ